MSMFRDVKMVQHSATGSPEDGLSTGEIIGILVGCNVAFFDLGLVAYLIMKYDFSLRFSIFFYKNIFDLLHLQDIYPLLIRRFTQ